MEASLEDWQRYFEWKETPDFVPTGFPEMQFPPEDLTPFSTNPFGLEGIPELSEDAPVPDLELDTPSVPANDVYLPQLGNGFDMGRGNVGNDEILRRLDNISARLAQLENTVTKTANDLEGVMHTARGALQNLVDLAEGFYDSIEKLKKCMGMFSKGLVEHFLGDDATLEVELPHP
ncbi:hypothetical protein CBS470a_005430 [Colletotrichum nupharicola]|nr:hypothetical protein CBS470a_005430 [Colletotrichum nupharicola]